MLAVFEMSGLHDFMGSVYGFMEIVLEEASLWNAAGEFTPELSRKGV